MTNGNIGADRDLDAIREGTERFLRGFEKFLREIPPEPEPKSIHELKGSVLIPGEHDRSRSST